MKKNNNQHRQACKRCEMIRTHLIDDLCQECAILKAIDDEPECPGTMPDEMWEAMRTDRDAVEETMRIAVRLTKDGIRARVRAIYEKRAKTLTPGRR